VPLDSRQLTSHRLGNVLQSVLLLGAMALLLGVLGWEVAGPFGLLASVWLGVLALVLSPKVSPRLILGMYKGREIRPREAPALHGVVAELAERCALPAAPRLYYVPSPLLNAFAVGSKADAAIAVTDGLLRELTLRELAAVIAHELSHLRHNDLWIMGLADSVSRITHTMANVGMLLLLLNLPLVAMGQEPVSWLAVAALVFAPAATALLQLALSRTREFHADAEAVALTGDPEGLAAALQKLEAASAHPGVIGRVLTPGRGLPDPSLLRTHPATEQRIERLRSLSGQRTGRESRDSSGWRLGEHSIELGETQRPVRRDPRFHWHSGLWH